MQRLAATSSRWTFSCRGRTASRYAVGFVLLCWLVVLTQLPEIDWGYVLPAIVFGNLVMVNFYFMAGLVLLEKGEGTLEAQVVTPLADWEYLVSKTVTLAALSLVEQFVIVGSAYGLGFGVGALIAGVALAAILYTLDGVYPGRPLRLNQRVPVSIGVLSHRALAAPSPLLRDLEYLADVPPPAASAARAAKGGVRADRALAVGVRRAVLHPLERGVASCQPSGVRSLHHRP